MLLYGVSVFSILFVSLLLVSSLFILHDSRIALAQFANTSVVRSFNDSGIPVSNISDTGFLPEIMVQLREPGLEVDENLSESVSSMDDSLESSSFDTDVSSMDDSLEPSTFDTDASSSDNTSTYLIKLEPKIESEDTTEEFEMLPVPESPGLLIAPPPSPSPPPPPLEDQVKSTLNGIRNRPNVVAAEPNELFAAQFEEALADDYVLWQQQQAGEKQVITYGFDRIDGDIAINELRNNSVDIDIALLDSGINPHPDLNLLSDRQVSFTGTPPGDKCGHGTHVAGIAAAKDNDIGIVGTAPGARLWNVKVIELKNTTNSEPECTVTKDSLIKGLDYVAEHADEIDVVNLSVGGFCNPNKRVLCNSPVLESVIDKVKSKGIIVIVAGGNRGDISGKGDSMNWKPAKFLSALTVSNFVDSDGKCGGLGNVTNRGKDDFFAVNSNYGEPLRIAAPGVNVLSTANNGSYSIYSGTSMAAPFVAGAAATYKSLNPSASVTDVISALLTNSVSLGAECDGEGFGYIDGDRDNIPEVVLNMKNLTIIEE